MAVDALGRRVALKTLDRGEFIECSLERAAVGSALLVTVQYEDGTIEHHKTSMLP
jgi:hypothetical protein